MKTQVYVKLMIAFLFGLFLSGCRNKASESKINTVDKEKIMQMISEYQEGWLKNDSSKVLALFADTATIIPSGLQPIKGKKQMVKFWWPNDSSQTFIDQYHISVLELEISDNLAYTFENGKLSWRYVKGDFKMSKDNNSFEITIFKKSNGQWKIVKRIWTDLK